ncbi:MAG: hypothetical protein QGG73_00935 [Candidatus Hydrogenedentes bacterium]|jgi:hypothetical protein|nr:hypothetical protein [Candidatus Hydrogenedentota bacterium]
MASYWSALSPAWVEVDFGRDCYIDEVTLRPYSASHGVKNFYAKIVDDSGAEHDTWPPASAAAPEAAEGSSEPLTARFDPVLTRRLRIYIAASGPNPGRAYVRKISVMGAPVESL